MVSQQSYGALLNTILSLNSYNRGYDAGIDLSSSKTLPGVDIIADSSAELIRDGQPIDENDGFYAIAYKINGDIVISYRGTDNPSVFSDHLR